MKIQIYLNPNASSIPNEIINKKQCLQIISIFKFLSVYLITRVQEWTEWLEKPQCRTLQCRVESVLKKLIRSQVRVIAIGRRMTLHRWMDGWEGRQQQQHRMWPLFNWQVIEARLGSTRIKKRTTLRPKGWKYSNASKFKSRLSTDLSGWKRE